jgi:hypothetical protein
VAAVGWQPAATAAAVGAAAPISEVPAGAWALLVAEPTYGELVFVHARTAHMMMAAAAAAAVAAAEAAAAASEAWSHALVLQCKGQACKS